VKERRLLERIAAWEDGGQRTNQTQVDILVRSVTNHLLRLLNTWRVPPAILKKRSAAWC